MTRKAAARVTKRNPVAKSLRSPHLRQRVKPPRKKTPPTELGADIDHRDPRYCQECWGVRLGFCPWCGRD